MFVHPMLRLVNIRFKKCIQNKFIAFEKCQLENGSIEGMLGPLGNSQKLEFLNLSGNKLSDGVLLGQAIAENASLKLGSKILKIPFIYFIHYNNSIIKFELYIRS